ncbi:MAG: MBL fold metallo-hydrolase, partial [Clostridia bacterium]|nr:MBL fold metallo-hydrolase [Clostridia bacterium]
LETSCYLLFGDEDPSKALIIDPADEADAIKSALGNASVAAILLTHGHFDHTGALMAFPDAPMYLGRMDIPMLNDPQTNVGIMCRDFRPRRADAVALDGGERLAFPGFSAPIQVSPSPGHTPGGLCYWINDWLFSGDTLFCHSYGRTDFPGGDERALLRSIRALLSLPGDLTVFPGHMGPTTLEKERAWWHFGGQA